MNNPTPITAPRRKTGSLTPVRLLLGFAAIWATIWILICFTSCESVLVPVLGVPVLMYDEAKGSVDQPFYNWMAKVNRIAKRKGYDISGDEIYFLRYFNNHDSPEQAIWHWEHDAWPNMGGGE